MNQQQFCVGIKTSKQKVKEKVGQVAETQRGCLKRDFIVSRGDWL